MTLGGSVQVVVAHCPNEWTLDPAVCSYCCVPLGSETRIYKFPSRKYRSIEVGNVVFPSGKLGILRASPTSDSEI